MVVAIKQEQFLQMAVCEFSRVHKLPFFHVPNEGKRHPATGSLLKKMGMVSGFADCFMPRGNKEYKGLFIELKVKPNKPTPNQIAFLEMMLLEGYDTAVCYTLEDAIAVIKQFYDL